MTTSDIRNVVPQLNIPCSKGVRYVTHNFRDKRYQARTRINGKEVSLGYFYTDVEAHNFYILVKQSIKDEKKKRITARQEQILKQ